MAQAQVVISAVDRTQGAINSAMKGLRGLGDQASILKRAFAGIGAVAVGQFLTRTAMSAIQYGDELQKASIKSGVAVEQLSALAYAAKQSDIDLGSLSESLKKMQLALSQATTGGKEQKKTLDALGISLEDIKNLNADEQFILIAQQISSLTNPADKARAATELFGKAGANLLPLFEQGADGIRKAAQEAKNLGLILSTEQTKKLADADDSVKRLSSSWQGFATTLVSKVAPALTAILDQLSGASKFTEEGMINRLDGLRLREKTLEEKLTRAERLGPNIKDRDLQITNLKKQLDDQREVIRNFLNQALPEVNVTTGKINIPPGFTKPIDDELSKYSVPIEIPVEVRANFAALQQMAIQVDLEIDIEKSLIEMRDQIATQLGEGGELGETIFDTLDTAMKDKTKGMTEFARTAAENMQNAFAQFLFDPFKDGLRGMLANFVNMLRQMVAQIVAQQILLAFFRMFTGGTGFMADFANAAVKSIEGRAIGGPVSQGTPYIVGERGPELFVPNSSGSIVPNNRMGGVTVAPVYNIDARGATADLQQALPGILKENNRRIFDELDRRYGIGR